MAVISSSLYMHTYPCSVYLSGPASTVGLSTTIRSAMSMKCNDSRATAALRSRLPHDRPRNRHDCSRTSRLSARRGNCMRYTVAVVTLALGFSVMSVGARPAPAAVDLHILGLAVDAFPAGAVIR